MLRSRLSNEFEIARVNDSINNSKYHIVSYNVLVGACEDMPQMLCVLIVGIINDGLHTFAYVSLGMSVSSILFKVTYCIFGKWLLGEDDQDMQQTLKVQRSIRQSTLDPNYGGSSSSMLTQMSLFFKQNKRTVDESDYRLLDDEISRSLK